jgi:hypothetical protein
MIVGNTVTVDRGFTDDGVAVYRVRFSYNDGDGHRDVEAVLGGAIGEVLFESVERAGRYDLAGRAEALGAAAAEAVELAKPVPEVK